MTGRSFIGAVAGLALAGSAGWYAASPYWALSALRDAAMAGDKAALERLIDFRAVRQSIKQELREGIAGTPDKANGPLAELGGAIAVTLAEPLVENIVTPAGIKSLVGLGKWAGSNAESGAQTAGAQADDPQWTIDRSGLNRFAAVLRSPSGSQSPTLIFRRDGLGWTLAAIDLNGGPK